MARSSSHPAGRQRTGQRRTLKIFLVGLAVLLLLLVLNAFALDRETGSASLNVDGATLVSTTSGDIQVLDTGEPVTTDPAAPDPLPVVLIHGSGGAINWWDDLIPLISPTSPSGKLGTASGRICGMWNFHMPLDDVPLQCKHGAKTPMSNGK